jgi:hypothetical protein
LFDTRNGVMAFTLNGKFSRELGDRTFVGVRHRLAFYPALSLGAFQQCRFNFGSEPFKYAQARPLRCAHAPRTDDALAAGSSPPTTRA